MSPAFRLRAPSVRFIVLAIFATGVRAFECDLSSFTSSFDQRLRCAVAFFVGTNNLLNTLVSDEGDYIKGVATKLTWRTGRNTLLAARSWRSRASLKPGRRPEASATYGSSDTPSSFLHFDGRDVSPIHTHRAEGLLEPLISGKLVFSSMALRRVTAKTFTGTPRARC
jgi:hypothetical protein